MKPLRDIWSDVSERLKGWKTIIFGTALVMSGFVLELLTFFQTIDLSVLFSPRSAVIANILIGLAIIVLRWYTTAPIGDKDGDTE